MLNNIIIHNQIGMSTKRFIDGILLYLKIYLEEDVMTIELHHERSDLPFCVGHNRRERLGANKESIGNHFDFARLNYRFVNHTGEHLRENKKRLLV